MKIFILILLVSFGTKLLYAQSKKEIIVSLTNRVDSLNEVVSKERIIIQQLRASVEQLENEKNALNENLEAQRLKKDTQLKIKQDSLTLLLTELFEYKPSALLVKQDNSGSIKTVTIGKQVWMLENLNVATFKNGVEIPKVQDESAWIKAVNNQQPAWCYYYNDKKNGDKFGKLYNWYAVVDNNGLCPQGWHVPSDDEWYVLTDYLGGSQIAGGKMKEVGITNWNSPNTESTNLSLFTGLPGGYRNYNGNYYYIGDSGFWWSSTEYASEYEGRAWLRYLSNANGVAIRYNDYKAFGISVRCLRD
jgi:uncharacterized protein (TIGR02145 family)